MRRTVGHHPKLSARPALDAALFARAVEECVDGVVAFDAAGRCTLWNPAMERLSGVPRAVAIGQPVLEVAPYLSMIDAAGVRTVLGGGRVSSGERAYAVPGSARVGALEAHFAPLDAPRGARAGGRSGGALGIVRDVSERRAAEDACALSQRAADRSRRLQALTAALSEAATVEEVADVIVFKGMEAIGADAGSLALIHDTGHGEAEFEIVRTSGFPTDVVRRYRFYPVTPGRPLSDAVRTRTPVLLGSALDWEERYPSVVFETRYAEFEGFAGVPIVSHGRVLAGLSFSFRGAQRFDDGVRTFLGTVSEQCAQALERARLLEAERRARRSAELARADAEAANRAKGEFLATMSHELRTPLNAIAGYCDLLLMEMRGPLTDAQRADLERVQRSQRHLLTLVQDVLDYATLDGGRADVAVATVDVRAVVDDAVDMTRARADEKSLAIVCRTADAPHSDARADAARLRQVLINLLTNAVKFTAPGGRVEVETTADERTVAVTVRDTGRGIDPAQHEAIFAPFVQLDRGYTRSADGMGLGLAIARDLARRMGGDVTVASAPGEGSAFTVRLPRARPPETTG